MRGVEWMYHQIKGTFCHCSPRSHWLKLPLCAAEFAYLKENSLTPHSPKHASSPPLTPNSEMKRENKALRYGVLRCIQGMGFHWILFKCKYCHWSHSLEMSLLRGMKNSVIWVWAALASTTWSVCGIFPRIRLYWWEIRHNWTSGSPPSAETTAPAGGLHHERKANHWHLTWCEWFIPSSRKELLQHYCFIKCK